MLPALPQDPVHRCRPHPRGPQQLFFCRVVYVYGKSVQVLHRNDCLGVLVHGQMPRLIEGQLDLFVGKLVDPLEPVHLVKPVRPRHGRSRVLFQGRVGHRLKVGVVGSLEVPFPIKLVYSVKNFPVRLIGRAHHELGGLTHRPSGLLPVQVVDPLHRRQDVPLQVLHLAQCPHPPGSRRLNIDRKPGPELVRRLDVLPLCPRHHLHVDIALETVPFTDDLHHVDQLRRGLGPGARHPRAEEQTVHRMALVQLHKSTRQLLPLECEPLPRDPVAVGAEVTVHLAKVGEHHPQQAYGLAVGHRRLVDAGQRVLLRVRIGPALLGFPLGLGQNIVAGHSSQQLEFFVSVGRSSDEHSDILLL